MNAYILVGNMYSNMKNYEGALEYYNKALALSPNDASIHVLIANTHYMNNQIEESLKSYRYAVNLVPETMNTNLFIFNYWKITLLNLEAEKH